MCIRDSLSLGCMSLILLSQFATHVSTHLEAILFVLGLILIALEFFLGLTYGILTGVGLLMSITGLLGMGLADIGPIEFSWSFEGWNLSAFSFLKGLGWFSGTILLSFLAMFLFSRSFFPRTKLFRKLVPLDKTLVEKAMKLPQIGSIAITTTLIRPQGQVEFKGEIFNAISNDGFINKDERVTIVSHEKERIIIRKI